LLKALVIGVSDYTSIKQQKLPFCKNDIHVVRDALESGLKIDRSNVDTCGETGIVTGTEFLCALNNLIFSTETDDTVIFYFSGHGGLSLDGHHLLLSDTVIKTKDIIEIL